MARSAWDSYRPVVIDLTRTIKKYIPVTDKSRPIFTTISIPIFSVSGIPWLGASFITTEFRVNLGVPINLILPIVPPVGANFCLAVRYPITWPSTSNIGARYKLWGGIGESLDYPIYNGETLPSSGFTLEIWTIIGSTVTSLSSPYPLKTSILYGNISGTNLACQCNCDTQDSAPNSGQDEYCSIFNPWNLYVNPGYSGYFPMQFNRCLNNIP